MMTIDLNIPDENTGTIIVFPVPQRAEGKSHSEKIFPDLVVVMA
jgi:hypothetical protein